MAGAGNDTLSGDNGDDVVNGGLDDDTLTGGNGSDKFVFATSFGKDVVTDFAHGNHIEIDNGLFSDFAAVSAASEQVGNDVVITFDAGDTITLQNTTLESLAASDFIFALLRTTVRLGRHNLDKYVRS